MCLWFPVWLLKFTKANLPVHLNIGVMEKAPECGMRGREGPLATLQLLGERARQWLGGWRAPAAGCWKRPGIAIWRDRRRRLRWEWLSGRQDSTSRTPKLSALLRGKLFTLFVKQTHASHVSDEIHVCVCMSSCLSTVIYQPEGIFNISERVMEWSKRFHEWHETH